MWSIALGEFCFREEFLAPNKSESHRSQEDARLKKSYTKCSSLGVYWRKKFYLAESSSTCREDVRKATPDTAPKTSSPFRLFSNFLLVPVCEKSRARNGQKTS